MIKAASFAWMSEPEQREMLRKLNRHLNNGNEPKPAKATLADLASLGIPVVKVQTKDAPSEG